MDKKAVVHIHDGILLGHEKEIEKQMSYINAYIYMQSGKTLLMNLFVGQTWRHRHRE